MVEVNSMATRKALENRNAPASSRTMRPVFSHWSILPTNLASCLCVSLQPNRRPGRLRRKLQGKCNRLPSGNERAIVERWAAVEGLRVAEAIRM